MASSTLTFVGLDSVADLSVRNRSIRIQFGTLLTLNGGAALTLGDLHVAANVSGVSGPPANTPLGAGFTKSAGSIVVDTTVIATSAALATEVTDRGAGDASVALGAANAVATETTNRTTADALLVPKARVLTTGTGMTIADATSADLTADRTIKKKSLAVFWQPAATQSIPDSTWTTVAYTNRIVDEMGAYDGVHNDRINGVASELYVIAADIHWAQNSIGLRSCRIMQHSIALGDVLVNDGTPVPALIMPGTLKQKCSVISEPGFSTDAIYSFVQVYQNSGGALNIVNDTGAAGGAGFLAGSVLEISHAGDW